MSQDHPVASLTGKTTTKGGAMARVHGGKQA